MIGGLQRDEPPVNIESAEIELIEHPVKNKRKNKQAKKFIMKKKGISKKSSNSLKISIKPGYERFTSQQVRKVHRTNPYMVSDIRMAEFKTEQARRKESERTWADNFKAANDALSEKAMSSSNVKLHFDKQNISKSTPENQFQASLEVNPAPEKLSQSYEREGEDSKPMDDLPNQLTKTLISTADNLEAEFQPTMGDILLEAVDSGDLSDDDSDTE